MSFTSRLIAKTEPWKSTSLEWYLKAVGKPFEQVAEIAEEQGTFGKPGWVPGYGSMLNPETCKYQYLPWLGQFVGVEVRKTSTEAEARAEVKAESGLERGTRKSLELLLTKALGEGVPFYIIEREPTAYHFVVVIPVGHLSNAVYEEISLTKAAGLLYEVVERAGTWYVVAAGKLWSAVKAGLKWSEAHEGEP